MLFKFLRRLSFTNKVAERLFQQRNDEAFRQHWLLRRQVPRRCIASVDETHTDGGNVLRQRGSAQMDE